MFTAQFIEKQQETPTDWSFRFTQPEGFVYEAGQYCVIRMPMKYPDDRFGARTCSISSSPTEPYVQFTFTIRETGFKKTLMELEQGTEVVFTPPRGFLTLNKVTTPGLMMIAGGIGVAPFRGLAKYIEDCAVDIPHATLLYSDKDHHEIAYAKEWEAYTRLSLMITLTRLDDAHPWTGSRGRISWEMIAAAQSTETSWTYMLCGSPEMVRETNELLLTHGISKEQILLELFTGY